MRTRSAVALAAGTLMLAACSGGGSAETPKTTIDRGTVPVGKIPGPLSDITDPPAPITVPAAVPNVGDGQVAPTARNNRVLLIGDVVVEVANGGDLACEVLNPQGWSIEVDAVGKATLGFGTEVVDARMQNGDFGVVGILLGTNITSTVEEFTAQYRQLISRIGPRPILVFTPAFDGENIAVLDAIRIIASDTPNVRIVDWGYATQEQPEVMLQGSFPTPAGSSKLWELASDALGQWGTGDGQDGSTEAKCLPAAYNSSTYTGPNQVA